MGILTSDYNHQNNGDKNKDQNGNNVAVHTNGHHGS